MHYVSAAFLLSLLMSFLILPKILFISHKKSLYDQPDERKTHKNPVPRLGGLAFFPIIFIVMQCCLVVSSLSGGFDTIMHDESIRTQFSALCIGGMSLYLIGVKDDLVGVGYKSKFFIQIFSGLLLALSGLWISSLGGISFLDNIPAAIGIPFSVFLCVYITNGINLIDGVDGLASGLSLIALSTMGLLFMSSGQIAYSILAFSGAGCLIPFFWVNVRRSAGNQKKLFMGDTGSLTLGYLLSFLFISLCVNKSASYFIDSRFHYIAFGALIIPLFDVVRVVLLRLRLRKPPFSPDRNHIHHKLLKTGMNDTQVMVFLLLLSVLFIVCNYFLTDHLYGSIVLFIDICIWFVLHGILDVLIKRRHPAQG